eukprot:CAMPEP_0204555428 /NCGR_PEP_ID=MMETSP0661-20131031/28830_1 /ASSEMBLY_ACC=CAM_ASM_000606 /TAXON_ID=109239 /ORGANISM="Alexandrium margalefi, Strain AMGDE01CS-322" /LENGTH=104 /DNA_ID=CAMNT_0051562519 /DNA_START=128 /DNA_END=439 /DNA_ORIENTATION=-
MAGQRGAVQRRGPTPRPVLRCELRPRAQQLRGQAGLTVQGRVVERCASSRAPALGARPGAQPPQRLLLPRELGRLQQRAVELGPAGAPACRSKLHAPPPPSERA